MKVSIITVVYNGANTIKETIESVLNQDYNNIEYIIIDGLSTDGTQDIVKSFGNKISTFISENDEGLYDAMNKGIKLATGDIVGILNADDIYFNEFVIGNLVKHFKKTKVDCVYSDLILVNQFNDDKIVRYYKSKYFKMSDFKRGLMPGHASVFIRRKYFNEYGLYDLKFKITADFDLLLRFLFIHKLSHSYLPMIMVKMRLGGISNQNLLIKYKMYKELMQVFKKNNIKLNPIRFLSKYFIKIYQYIDRPKYSE